MTREEAYNRIDAIIAKYEKDDDYVIITSVWDYDALIMARKALEQEPKWIHVSERLPEDGERVLVTYDKIVIRATWDLMRFSFYDTHAASLDKDFVYAWMPLPKPYEPQESEE